jgi:hypothetical protein
MSRYHRSADDVPEDESGEVVYESSLISVSQDVKTVTG